MSVFNDYHRKYATGFGGAVPAIRCADGFIMSVQASEYTYCTPRQTMAHPYTAVEVGFPSEAVPEFMPYAETPETPTETVYGCVPVEIVEAVIKQHGGIKE